MYDGYMSISQYIYFYYVVAYNGVTFLYLNKVNK